jgi:uncharacterized protein (DUF305 family)
MQHDSTHHDSTHHGSQRAEGHYLRLAMMVAVSFVAMYVLMYAMVDRYENVFHNINQVYMAGLMASVMVPIELALMSAMYPDKRKNIVAVATSVIALVGFWLLIRNQTAVGDRQFLRSMIPHHGAAILMCRETRIERANIVELCRRIVESQEAEIAEMKAYLRNTNP